MSTWWMPWYLLKLVLYYYHYYYRYNIPVPGIPNYSATYNKYLVYYCYHYRYYCSTHYYHRYY